MSVRIREVKKINILDVEGKIDINSSDIIETVGWLVNTGKVNMIINLENVDLVDYNGLSILAIAYKSVMNHKGRMKFLRVPLPVLELFKVVKLDTVFDNFAEEEGAINSFYEDEVEKLKLRRKFQRLDINLIVNYRLVGEQKKARPFSGKVLNISAAGVYIYSPHTFPISSILDLEFSLPDSSAGLEATGRVVYLADKEIQPHAYPGMGVSFIHLTSEREKAIVDFIDKNISHRAEPI